MTVHPVNIPHSTDLLEVTFAPQGDTLYVAANSEVVNLWSICVFHWPEILGGLLALILLVCTWRLVRIVRRPRIEGRVYCGRCNYDVTDAPPTCPECGRDLEAKPARPGKTRLRRSIPTIVIVLVTCLLYAMPWAMNVGRQWPAVAGWFQWDSAEAVTWIQDRPITRLQPFVRRGTELLAVNPATAEWRRVAFVDLPFAVGNEFDLKISPDGRWATLRNDYQSLTAIDLQSGGVIGVRGSITQRVTRGRPSVWTSVAGYNADSSSVFAVWHNESERRVSLVEWNPVTQAVRIVEERESNVYDGGRIEMVEAERWTRSVTGEPGQSARFLSMYGTVNRSLERKLMEVAVVDDQGGAVEAFGVTPNSQAEPYLCADGSVIFLDMPRPMIKRPDEKAQPLKLQPPPAPVRQTLGRLVVSPDESHLLGLGHETMVLWNLKSGQLLASVDHGSKVPAGVALSAGGRSGAMMHIVRNNSGRFDKYLDVIRFPTDSD